MSRTCLRRLLFFCIPFYMSLTLALHSQLVEISLHVNKEHFRKKVIYNTSRNIATPFENKLYEFNSNNSAANERHNSSQPKVLTALNITSLTNFTLPKFDKQRPIVFLHISKNGGTSFEREVAPIVRDIKGKYVGYRYFDWSYIDRITKANVVVLLREPVARAVSHYYFMRRQSNNKLSHGSLSKYLHDPKAMLETRDCWQDGQASVLWLTGKHIAKWVRIPKGQVPSRERISLNIRDMCLLAAKRLESTFWFGIIEDSERSLELLQYQLGLTEKITLPRSNVNRYPKATENETLILASLMPQDIWLYEYAKLLFEARWTYYKTGFYKHPNMPPVPTLENIPCISTRSILLCKKGPFSPLYYVDQNATVQDQSLPNNILNKLKMDRNLSMETKSLEQSHKLVGSSQTEI